MYSSWVLENVMIGNIIRLRNGITTIGRSVECSIRPTSIITSKKHANITIDAEGNTVVLRDLGGMNGTYINDKYHKNETITLKDGDKIGFGAVVDEADYDDCDDDTDNPFAIFILKFCPRPSKQISRKTSSSSADAVVKDLAKSLQSIESSTNTVVGTNMPSTSITQNMLSNNMNLNGSRNENKSEIKTRVKKTYENIRIMGTIDLLDESNDGFPSTSKPKNTNLLNNTQTIHKTIIDIFGDDNFPSNINLNDNPIAAKSLSRSNTINSDKAKGTPLSACDDIFEISDDEDVKPQLKECVDDKSAVIESILNAFHIKEVKSINSLPLSSSPPKAHEEVLPGNLNDNEDSNEADENFLLSQNLLKDCKAELEDYDSDYENHTSKMSPVYDDVNNDQVQAPNKVEYKLSPEYNRFNDIDDDDDDDVTLKWKEKIFSQSFKIENDVIDLVDNDMVGENVPPPRAFSPQFDELPTSLAEEQHSPHHNDKSVQQLLKYNCTVELKRIPPIISAPSLPVHKGKLRGVSATSNTPTAKDRIISHTKAIAYGKEMKAKFLQSPSAMKKKQKQKDAKFVEKRKDKLRDIAAAHPCPKKQSVDETNVNRHKTVPKVKVTLSNRGAFLTETHPDEHKGTSSSRVSNRSLSKDHHGPTSKSSHHKSENRKRKIDKEHRNGHNEEKRSKMEDNTKAISFDKITKPKVTVVQRTPAKMSFKSIEKEPIKPKSFGPIPLFDRKISEISENAKECRLGTSATPLRRLSTSVERLENITNIDYTNNCNSTKVTTKRPPSTSLEKSDNLIIPAKMPTRRLSTSGEVPKVKYTEAKALPATSDFMRRRAARHSVEVSKLNLRTPAKIQSRRTSLFTGNRPEPIRKSCLVCPSQFSKFRTKKKVQFNDLKEVFIFHADLDLDKPLRKVNQKDVEVKLVLSYRERLTLKLRKYPIVDNTEQIISEILTWKPEWLYAGKHNIHGSDHVLIPIMHQFTSFQEYKSVLFPLLKAEIWGQIENAFLPREKSINGKMHLDRVNRLEHKRYGDRILLLGKYYIVKRKDIPDVKIGRFDIVCVHIGDKSKYGKYFGYVTVCRKGIISNNQYYALQIELKYDTKLHKILDTCKDIRFEVVVQNCRNEVGSFNAVDQIQHSPLFNQIINPFKINEHKPASIENIAYKGDQPLNENQQNTLLKTYVKAIDSQNPSICLVKGPPGTGKSRLISNLAVQILYGNEVKQLDQKILICAQSNAAVDVITRNLLQIRPRRKFNLVRYAEPEKVHNDVKGYTLQNIVRNNYEHERSKDPKWKSYLDERKILNMRIAALECNKGEENVKQDDLMKLKERLKIIDQVICADRLSPMKEDAMNDYYIKNAHIVCSTLSRCVTLSKYIQYFDICIVDEATQSMEPATLIPLKFGINCLILVGDSQQLPATIISQTAKEHGLGRSFFTRIEDCLSDSVNNPIACLRTQYRMHPEISIWPNLYFYQNLLINGDSTSCETTIKPFSVLSLDYNQNDKCRPGRIVNNLEADFVTKLILSLNKQIPSEFYSYGIITPYADHRDRLEHTLRQAGIKHLMVNTVDSYQGCEKDVIIISNARTKGVGFLDNCQRLNVALTRAKKCLILCGNFGNLEVVPVWKSLLKNAKERGHFHCIRAADVDDFETGILSKIRKEIV